MRSLLKVSIIKLKIQSLLYVTNQHMLQCCQILYGRQTNKYHQEIFLSLMKFIKYYNPMSNRLHNESLPSPSVKDSLRASQPSSTHSHNTLFLTQKRQHNHQAQILQRHALLNGYIEDLDAKVQRIVEHNEAELLFAYRNHLETVRLQMCQFKEETQQALESEVTNKQKIEIMEKQLIVFREEALKLFDKALKKDKEIQQLQLKLEEGKSQRVHMNNKVKQLIKRNKQLEADLRIQQDRRQQTNDGFLGRVQVNSFVSLGISSHKKMLTRDRRIKDRVLTSSSNNNSKHFTQSHFMSKQETKPTQPQLSSIPHDSHDTQIFARRLKMKLSYIQPQLLQSIVQSATELYTFFDHKSNNLMKVIQKEAYQPRQTKSSLRSKSYHTCDSNSRIKRPSQSRYSNHRQLSQFPSDSPQNFELRDCFRRCVEVVKKQIARRRQINTLNFFKHGSPISLEDFKKMDFMRLAELVFTNERLIQVLYCNLFSFTS